MQGSSNVTEQAAFNAVVRRGMRPVKTHAGNYRVFYGMDGRATFGVLPLAGFLNGHGYFVQRLHEVRRPLLELAIESRGAQSCIWAAPEYSMVWTAALIACCYWAAPHVVMAAFCTPAKMNELQPTEFASSIALHDGWHMQTHIGPTDLLSNRFL